jgi:membrane protein implicated in regulation of membrane protease activity
MIRKLIDAERANCPLSENRYILIKVLSCINTIIWLVILYVMHYVWHTSWGFKLLVLSVLLITTPSLGDLKKPYEQYLKEWEDELRHREIRRISGTRAMIQKRGIVIKKCAPEGKVRIGNELWTALSIDGTEIDIGEHIFVRDITGMKLIVEKIALEKRVREKGMNIY